MKWLIAADSACDLNAKDVSCPEVELATIPFFIQVAERTYIDDEALDIPAMLDDMEQTTAASHTACPSPEAWAAQFKCADNVIAVTISGRLSGSLNSAAVAKEMVLAEYPEKNIAIIDSKATGPEAAMCIAHIAQWIKANLTLGEIISRAEEFLVRCKTSFALSSFDNLVKNGRMNRFLGFVAKKLGLWGIGIGSDEGVIAMRGKAKGAAKAIENLLEDMEQRGYAGGEVLISHCLNLTMAQRLRSSIMERWQAAKNIQIIPTRGLDSFYAERGGLIVGFLSA